MQTIQQIITKIQSSPSKRPAILGKADPEGVRLALARHYIDLVNERGLQLDPLAAGSVIEIAVRWLTQPGAKPWLFLSGNVGTGKTTLMKAIARTLTDYTYTARMFKASDFPALFLNNVEQTELQLMQGNWCRVLLLDDIGVEPTEIKEYGNVIRPFVKIVEERYNRQLPLVVSTNLSGQEMRDTYGERTIDRIKEMATAIKYQGKSFRK